jgi:hypothetical protein
MFICHSLDTAIHCAILLNAILMNVVAHVRVI